MQSLFSHYAIIARRWAWLIVLGMGICGGTTYVISKFIPPVYQASVILIVNADPTSSQSVTSSITALPTYTQLLTNPLILEPVLAEHQDMTLQQLNSMVSAKPVAGTQLIELDVTNGNAQLAKQLADEISQSFARFSNSQLPGTIQILPARVPDAPISPKPSLDAGIGALVGLGLAIAMIVIFEWFADRLSRPEEVQEILHSEILMDIPRLSNYQLNKKIEESPAMAEECRALYSKLNVAQATNQLKLVMVASALKSEGKSTIAQNIASFLATAGKRVLLIDANIHHPVLHQYFHLSNQTGFSNILHEKLEWVEVEHTIQPSAIANLFILTAGIPPSDYVRLLQSQQGSHLFKYFNQAPFDYILFDVPPLLEVVHATILACYIQTAILVVDASKTPRSAVLRAKKVLDRTDTTILGVAINKSYWSGSGDRHIYPDNLMQSRSNSLRGINPDFPTRFISAGPPFSPQEGEDTIKLNIRRPNHQHPSRNEPL